jgi:hypothetical protein
MAWKNLFLTGDEKKTETETTTKVDPKKETTLKFPTSEPQMQQSPSFGFNQTSSVQAQPSGQLSQELVAKFFEAYENAFNELNQPGYDFFEFFQAIINGDINNAQFYNMAFAMGKGMDKTITKEKLLSQSDYYITELTKLYDKNVNDGTQKKADAIKQKENENQSLSNELNSLRQQFSEIQMKIKEKESSLSLIDSKYQPKIEKYDASLMANDFAKNKILSTIETVKQGISNNLKS